MDFQIDTADSLKVSDLEISELLSRVYVDGGFVAPELAASLFEPSEVRSRGKIVGAREKLSLKFAGMVIIVYPNSSARRLAQGNETEMQLLGVMPEYRGQRLGRMLVAAAMNDAKQRGFLKCCYQLRQPCLLPRACMSHQDLFAHRSVTLIGEAGTFGLTSKT